MFRKNRFFKPGRKFPAEYLHWPECYHNKSMKKPNPLSAHRGSAPGLVMIAGLAAVLLTVVGSAPDASAAEPAAAAVPLQVRLADSAATPTAALEPQVTFPGECSVQFVTPQKNCVDFAVLEVDVTLPATAPARVQALFYMKDWDYFWFQYLVPGPLVPGKTTRLKVSLLPDETGWQPKGHRGAWYHRALMEPKDFGVRVFSTETFAGNCRFENARLLRRAPATDAPAIRNVRVNRNRVPCLELFEVTFDLPDRYADPFDPEQIAVAADFEDPAGQHLTVNGFYAHDYIWRVGNTEERFLPQGPPFWRLRFAPAQPGIYKYTITAKDAVGSTRWGPGTLEATATTHPGIVKVSTKDPRYFEFADGAPFFPIGHNVRSPFDSRMDQQFPWAQRWPEGSAAYLRYFKNMRKHGENLAEIWSAAWSLGLEWTPIWRGYHGIGQYNMVNAWEMDRVFAAADAEDIYLNLVVLNHGKFSTWCDPEWNANPFNRANGGFLDSPDEFFGNAQAQAAFKKLMRYMIARWGYSHRLFAWELWSELNLAGTSAAVYRQQPCVEWHRMMGRWVKENDPFKHLVATHVSTDYNAQNTDIISLPEMDHCPVDAYHGQEPSLYIVTLLRLTALFNNPYKKPVFVTEFGGNWNGQDIKHLDDALHAALWSSTCIPLGGTPLFWWWQVVEEENFYPKYLAISRFMAGEDRRHPEMVTYTPQLLNGKAPAVGIDVQCLKDKKTAIGWIFCTTEFDRLDPVGEATVLELKMVFTGMAAGAYNVEFWDTVAGRPLPVKRRVTPDENDTFTIDVPPFARDLAFKVKPVPP